jgi:hypothetical protein
LHKKLSASAVAILSKYVNYFAIIEHK